MYPRRFLRCAIVRQLCDMQEGYLSLASFHTSKNSARCYSVAIGFSLSSFSVESRSREERIVMKMGKE